MNTLAIRLSTQFMIDEILYMSVYTRNTYRLIEEWLKNILQIISCMSNEYVRMTIIVN